ncbi:MAG: mannose-1-phosphate guanylyltransferase [Spirochaetota bacterium]
MDFIPVILAGGAGKRLWPLSREDKPKQFQNLSGEGTLLEMTIKRMIPLSPEYCLVVTSKAYEEASAEQIQKTGVDGAIISEPFPRNTAAAVLYAATYLQKKFGDAIMAVLPADHYIKSPESFIQIMEKAMNESREDKLVTIGVTPTYPETGYGYIKAFQGPGDTRQVEMFVEKPNLETARKYLLEGNYFWNSGIFVWKVSVIIECFKKPMPDLYNAFEPMRSLDTDALSASSGDAWEVKKKVFETIESVSIDYGIMEKADRRVVIPGEFGWADLGSWPSIDDILQPDECMNRTPSPEKVLFHNSRGCSVFTEQRRIAVVGLDDVVIVEAGNDVLVMDKNSAQQVRDVVDLIHGKN